MPPRDRVDPAFDGHLERPFAHWSPAERLDWIWETMVLLRAAQARRVARRAPTPDPTGS